MRDVLGEAIWDYHHHEKDNKLWIHNRYGRKEEMPLSIYFREEDEMPELELLAMQQCRGKVLDIGAGAGSHSLVLQQMGVDVTALDISPKAVAVSQQRGVQKAIQANIFEYQESSFDTLLLLMNGIGLTGTLKSLQLFLQHSKTLLATGGQILFDSSDVAYLYKKNPMPRDKYYGEIEYQYQYKGQKGAWFNWLYVDTKTLKKAARAAGYKTEILFDDGYDQYLARLTLKGF